MSFTPPYSEDAEQAVLSAAFMEPAALVKARVILTSDAFFRSAHAKLFQALCSIADRGEVPDPVTLLEQLTATGELDACGGRDFIGYLVDVVPTAANIEYHAGIVRDKADRRNVIAVGESMIESARDLKLRPDAVAQQATSDLLPVAAHTKSKGFVPIGEVLVTVLEDIWNRKNTPGGMAGVTWGYDALDFETGGQRPGELAFHCGVPGSGKTAFVVNRAVRVAKKGKRVAIISAEMGMRQLVERILNTDARISSKAARKGQISDHEWEYMVKVGVNLKDLPLHIDDTAQPNMRDIKAKVRALKAKYPDLALVVVDFVQLLKDTGDDNRSLELTEISYGLKGLGKETETAMDVTCQVDASAVEKTSDNRPQLHHLRWSQGMREAADFVNLQFNPSQYDPNAPSVIEQSWRKARDLAVFTTKLRWIAEYMLVDDLPVRAVA